MLFKKLKVTHHKDESIYWVIMLCSPNDVLKYMITDKERYGRALLSMQKEDGTTRIDHCTMLEKVLAVSIESKLFGDNETDVMALDVLDEVCDQKLLTMLSLYRNHGDIMVSESGGYSDYKTFSKIYSIEVLEEIEKDDVGFPQDKVQEHISYLLLENGEGVSNEMWDLMHKITNHASVTVIRDLKIKDQNYVIQSIHNADTIAFETQAADLIQIEQFSKIFLQMPSKRIIIKTNHQENIKELNTFPKLAEIHKIEFHI